MSRGVGGGNGNNNDDHPTITNRFPKCTKVFTSFGQLKDIADDIPDHCMGRYIFALEIHTIESALKKYNALNGKDYDAKFDIYAGYVEDQVPLQTDAFVSERGNDYFDCKEYTKLNCCRDCTYATCLEDCARGSNCKSGHGFRDITRPSRLKDSNEPGAGPAVPNTTWIMQDEDQLFKDIYDECSIEKGWIKFGTVRVNTPEGCHWGEEDINDCIDRRANKFFNFISGLLFFIPFVGSAIGSVGMSSLRSILSLVGAGVGRGGFRDTAETRRGMSSKEVNSLGPMKGKGTLDMVSDLQGSRCSSEEVWARVRAHHIRGESYMY